NRRAAYAAGVGPPEHGVAAASRRAVAAQRPGEAVRRRDGAPAEREPADTPTRSLRQVDGVGHAAHDVEVEARDAVVDQWRARLIGAEVPSRLLEVRLELVAGDADRAQRVLVGIDPRHVALSHFAFRKARTQVEVGGGRDIGAG